MKDLMMTIFKLLKPKQVPLGSLLKVDFPPRTGIGRDYIPRLLIKCIRHRLVSWHTRETRPVLHELVLSGIECVGLICHRILLAHVAKEPEEELTVWHTLHVAALLSHVESDVTDAREQQDHEELPPLLGVEAACEAGHETSDQRGQFLAVEVASHQAQD